MVSQEQNEIHYSGGIETSGYLSNNELPFWMFTNTYGKLSQESNGLIAVFAKANYQLSTNSSLELKASGIARDGVDPNIQRSELYLNFKNKWIDIVVGSKDFTDDTYQLSTVGRNILFSANTRALPGILIQNAKPIKISKRLSFDAAIAHYVLNDSRFIEKAKVHYKNFYLNWEMNAKNKLSVGLQHVAQWGGTSSLLGKQPSGVSDFARIFFGSGGGENASFGDQINSLGNHIGSYSITYEKRTTGSFDFDLYHQSLFEDGSGRELSNFPDGVWGISVSPKESKLFKKFIYEYVQTISQSGRPLLVEEEGVQSGGDNYFTNSTYRSGWTYEGRTIGLPFINVVTNSEGIDPNTNNRSIAHHIGALGSFWKLNYVFKLTYLQNLGTYAVPRIPRETSVFSYFKAILPTEKIGAFTVEIGADFNDSMDNTFGVGLGYKYGF